MLSLRHLKGRNYTGTAITLSKIRVISAPSPPQGVSLWFQGNGSHLQWMVSLCLWLIDKTLVIGILAFYSHNWLYGLCTVATVFGGSQGLVSPPTPKFQ
jgi:hypothetical protein